MSMSHTDISVVSDIISDVRRQQEAFLLEQLGDLVRDEVLLIEQTQPIITREVNMNNSGFTLKMSQAVRLTYKGFEKMQELKDEVNRLKKLNTALMEEISKSNE